MRTSSLLLLFLLVTALAKSQDYAGFNTGNYTGVHAAFFNPAGIADSRYRWDVNLFSVSTLVLNNQADFSIKDFSTGFDTKKLENKLLGNNSLPTSALVSADFHGPSFMFNAGKKTSIALTSRVRVMSRLSNLEGKLWGELLNSAEDTQYPFTVNSSQNQRIAIHGWSEFGLTWGQVLLQQHKHFLKGGITGKFLGGAAASGIQLDNIRATIAEDADLEAYLTNTSGRFGMALAGVSLDDFEVQELLKFKNSGIGFDVGFVYEYRPDGQHSNREENKYKWRIGLALMDIGKINYQPDPARTASYNLQIGANQRFYFNELEGVPIDDLKGFFDQRPQYFAPAGNSNSSVSMSLPTTLRFNVDYHLSQGWYINGGAQISMVSNSSSKPYNTAYYNGFSLTPRFEGRGFGFYVPVAYNQLSKLAAGVGLRFGPLFLGTGSGLTALLGTSKQADAYVGLRIGGLHKKVRATTQPKN